ncbi:formylmethanofuran dehydrogenase subunit E region [Methanolacinia petrolearia DSM 11571]|uniref:Formylmethanofuran dehydrogenase subunit E region n=1 Tax=Methanolacinia petrolearia (strain DSM 11571 / OCM 486 / SEBR 4847) TaxID=679926 RepID=E1RJ66_METP4|nr:formylmethanofuran dehydrogenase subunit E family protein [Methanolacinia petrolearia]ADN36736.1 formylmethanofuran dehydrogenase subunit E region [Methanolacinia petrolearia DSM 11571]
MKWHEHCRYMELEREYSVRDLALFHGHLGPYIVLGYRIGRYASEYFGNNPFEMKAKVYCSGTTPQSCLADGVQLGSGCTIGKRNIELEISDDLKCEFESGEKKIILIPKRFEIPKSSDEDYELIIEEFAEKMYGLEDSELFEVSGI